MKPRSVAPQASSDHNSRDGWPFSCPDPTQRVSIHADEGRPVEFAWGAVWEFGSAAYWISQYLLRFGQARIPRQAIGQNLLEETAACILGGHGVSAEVALAAFRAVRDAGLLTPGQPAPASAFEGVLADPISISLPPAQPQLFYSQRQVRYRFFRQRARRLAAAGEVFARECHTMPADPAALRDWLLRIPGVGLKTASWIIRNQTGSDTVAIVDIHLRRAGLVAGFFSPQWHLPRDYRQHERAFLAYAAMGCVPASGLDALIWEEQRIASARQPVRSWLPPTPSKEFDCILKGIIQ